MSRPIALLAAILLAPPAFGQEVIKYYHLDAIGSVRVVTDAAGAVVERHDYLPFGEECLTGPCANNPGAGAGQPRKFTGKERDAETGLDYFGARYYRSNLGRFTTVDPVYTWKENLVDPQRWNRYAYVRNNPLRYVDPDGRESMSVIYMSQNPSWGRKNPPLKQEAALWGGMIFAGVLSYVALTAVEMTPALVIAAQNGVGRCGASPDCQNAATGLAEVASGVPPGAMGVVPTFRLGHTFTKHGAAMTEQIVREAEATGRSVGQWLDDAAARNFIGEHLSELKNGAKTLDLPEGLGRMVRPDRSFTAATKARLVPSGTGVKTAFPTE